MSSLIPESKKYIEGFNHVLNNLSEGHQVIRELFKKTKSNKSNIGQLEKVQDLLVPIDKTVSVKIRVYTPKREGPLPILLYFHGGGWVLGDLDTCDATCRLIAELTERIVVSVDYRLSPEYKFPIPVNDCYAVLTWINENATLINGDATNMVVCGDSAGGNIATVVSLMARDKNGPKISAQVLIYPVTSFNSDTDSYKKYGVGFGLTKELAIWYGNHYIRDENDKLNQYAAPLLADDLSNLPPTFIIAAENDVLRDDGFAYSNRLRDAGVKVEYICEKGLVHGYFTNIDIFPKQVKKTVTDIAKFLEQI